MCISPVCTRDTCVRYAVVCAYHSAHTRRLSFQREYPDVLEHWSQLVLLLLLAFLAGAMLGVERSVLSIYGETEFHVSKTLIMMFIVSFGLSKCVSSLLVGEIADRFGRKATLITGWILSLPIYFMIMFAPSWTVVVLANIFMGFHQGTERYGETERKRWREERIRRETEWRYQPENRLQRKNDLMV